MTSIRTRSQSGRPLLAVVVAMSEDRVIGKAGQLPWNIPEELQLFRKLTLGGTLIMGHRTFRSIGKALEGRINIVLSRQTGEIAECLVASSFIEALQIALQHNRPIFVIGGASVYRKALPVPYRLNISWVTGTFTGDSFFPDFDLKAWHPISETLAQSFRHVCYQRQLMPRS